MYINLHEPTRVPSCNWYYIITIKYVAFINESPSQFWCRHLLMPSLFTTQEARNLLEKNEYFCTHLFYLIFCIIYRFFFQVLIPVFALGRAQELCILLETYWDRMNLSVPIFFSMGLTEKATNFYKLFITWTNQKIKNTFVKRNMFEFQHIRVRFCRFG